MKTRIYALLVAASATVAILPGAAQAQSIYGSAAILTNRNCTDPVGTDCNLGGPRIFTQFAGGMSTDFTTSASNMNGLGASGAGQVAFGAGYLPVLHVASSSGAATRTGASITAFRSFTYEGTEAINFALNGVLDFTSSGQSSSGDAAGEGTLVVLLNILPVSALSEFDSTTTAADIVNSPVVFSDCGSGATASNSYVSLGTGAGYHAATIGLSQTCGGAPITLNPGDQFVILATMQGISNRGGFIDAMNTFKVQFDLENTVFTATGEAVGADYLERTINGAVPEPASWAMMIAGFGLVGGAMRRRPAAALA